MSEKYVCPFEDPLPPRGGSWLLVAKGVLDLGISTAAVAVNAFILWAVVPGTMRRRLGRPSRMLVISLAAADALSGLALFQYHLSQNVCPLAHWVASRPACCLAKFILAVFAGVASINSLAAIGYDRYLCIVHSLRYQQLMTTRRAWLLVAAVWGVAAAASSLLLLGHRWQPPETPCVDEMLLRKGILLQVIVPINTTDLVVIAVTHVCIRREVRRSEAGQVTVLPLMPDGAGGRAAGAARSSADSGTSAASGTSGKAARGAPERRPSAGTIKSAYVLALVVGCYVLAFVPVLIVMLLRLLGVGQPGSDSEQGMEWAFRFGYSVAGLHNVVNPFIYVWKNKPLKADVVRLWGSLRGRQGQGAVALVESSSGSAKQSR